MTDKDRYYIEIQLKRKTSVKDIADALGFSRVAVYAEIKRGLCIQRRHDLTEHVVYLSDYAERDADAKKKNHGDKKHEPDSELLAELCRLIKHDKYSPYAAIKKLGCEDEICERTLYNYIYTGYIPGMSILDLPYSKPKKKKPKTVKRPFSRGKSIEERPKDVLNRDSYGHWEMDTVYSSKDDLHCLLVLSERMSREEIIIKIKDRTSKSVIRALDGLERKIGTPAFRDKFKTITCDNGMEFADWQSIERSCRTKGRRTETYFCHPYCSGERGTNENINRMIRRFVPKGDDIGLYSSSEIQHIQDWINSYPRRLFDGRSANDVKRCRNITAP
jgi:IS30 family transposase